MDFLVLSSLMHNFIICRMEKLEIKRSSSQAKVLGAVVAVTGALVVTLYKGPPVLISSSSNFSDQNLLLLSEQSRWIIGGFLILLVCLSSASWNVLQVKHEIAHTQSLDLP